MKPANPINELIKYNHVEDTLARRALEFATLYQTSLEINAHLKLPNLLKAIIIRAAELVGAHMGGIFLLRQDQRTLKLVVCHNLPTEYTGMSLKIGEGLAGRIAQTGQSIIVENYSDWEGRVTGYNQVNFCKALGVPLKISNSILGVLIISDDQRTDPFSQNDIYLISMFADQAAIAIENARLYQHAQDEIDERKKAEEQLLQRNRELSLLNHIMTTVTSTLDPTQVLIAILHELTVCLNVSQAGIALLNASKDSLVIVSEYPFNSSISALRQSIPVKGNPSTQFVLDTLQPLSILNAQHDQRTKPVHALLKQRNVASMLLLPLIVRGEAIGTIGLDSFEPRQFTPDEITLSSNAAAVAAQAIENSRLFAEMKQMAITDTLTGLLNRRGLLQYGEKELERSRRFNRPLSIIMLDVDNLKQINDQYSHTIGDQVLVKVAQICRQYMREIDIIGRPGGDEFVIILPETDLTSVQVAAERMRLRISESPLQVDQTTIYFTASLGVCEAPKTTLELATLIDCADQAMYHSKQSGKDHISMFPDIGEIN
jgi:diguanylate cyclase (GGDEF)-like protein